MSNPPAGWYQEPDTNRPHTLRWWDGVQWTEHRKADDTNTARAQATAKKNWLQSLKPKLSTILATPVFLFLSYVGFQSSGLSGLLIMMALITIITAIYTLVTKRPSWAQLPSRKMAGLIAGIGVITLFGGAVIALPVTPVPVPTSQAQLPGPGIEIKEPSAKLKSPEADLDAAPLDPMSVHPVTFAPSVVAVDSTVTAKAAAEVLETLDVKGRAAKTGYDRKSKFGTAWMDVDGNGCDTRNDILKRDFTAAMLAGTCKVLSGTLNDPYSGKTIEFTRGNDTSSLVQIDHIVSLSDAWQKGAQQLTQEQRITFANDPLNLFAVAGAENSAKGSGDTATWLPKNKDFRCEYVARQISVKATYGLWVTQPEKDAMKRVLTPCAGQEALTSQFTPAPAPAPEPDPIVEAPTETTPQAIAEQPAPAPAPAPAPSSTYYKNCTAARAVGAAPVSAGDPGYGKHLDRDGDGIGCE